MWVPPPLPPKEIFGSSTFTFRDESSFIFPSTMLLFFEFNRCFGSESLKSKSMLKRFLSPIEPLVGKKRSSKNLYPFNQIPRYFLQIMVVFYHKTTHASVGSIILTHKIFDLR